MIRRLELWIDTGIDYERRKVHIVADLQTEEGEPICIPDRTIVLEIEGGNNILCLTADQAKELSAVLDEGAQIILQADSS